MTRVIHAVFVLAVAGQQVMLAQGSDVSRVLAGLRAALGGEGVLSAVKTVAIEGHVTRARPDGTSAVTDFEMSFELPDKYVKKDVFAQLGPTQLSRRTGFNGADPIEEMDAPPAMGGGGVIMRMAPGSPMPGGTPTPELLETQRQATLVANRREFARLTLGMLGAAPSAYPLEFTYAGQAESPDGKADILDVKSQDGFAARLFVDAVSHLPLMLTWMDKEPLRLQAGPGGMQVIGAGDHRPTHEDADRIRQEMEQRVRDAEAKRRTVEYRVFYSEYKNVNGVRLPSKIQRMVDGLPTEELALVNVKVNGKIDESKFKVTK